MESINTIRAYGVCGPWARLASLVLDIVIGSAVIGAICFGAFLALPEAVLSPAMALAMLGALYLAYHVLFLCAFGGLPAQLLMGQRVIDREERWHLSPPAAILRALGGAGSFLCLGLGYLPMFFTARSQALHDFPCNAVVIRLREAQGSLHPSRPITAAKDDEGGPRRVGDRREPA